MNQQVKKDGYNVLSLFGGMECGYIALKEAGIKINKYYSAEIDKYAKTVSAAVGSDIIHVGSVTDVFYKNGILYTSNGQFNTVIDFVIGGSPCQGFSFAGKQLNFDDPRSRLFFEFVRIKKEVNPKYFLLENVKMKKVFQDVISETLLVQPIEINSALVSAQNRKRIYWTNIIGVMQPVDEKIFLKDVLEDGSNQIGASRGRYIIDSKKDSNSVGKTEQKMELRPDNKSNTLTTVQKDNYVVRKNSEHSLLVTNEGEGSKIRDKSKCVRSSGRNSYDRHEWNSVDELHWRKLTPRECGRLQTIPEDILTVRIAFASALTNILLLIYFFCKWKHLM